MASAVEPPADNESRLQWRFSFLYNSTIDNRILYSLIEIGFAALYLEFEDYFVFTLQVA